MAVTAGRKLLTSFDYDGVKYNVCAFVDTEIPCISLQIIKGDWQAASPEFFFSAMVDPYNQKDKPLQQYLQEAVDKANVELLKLGGGVVIPPDSFLDAAMVIFYKLAVFNNSSGVPQLRFS